MTEVKTRGPVQIYVNDITEINRALAQFVEWIDELFGLRGGLTIYDDVSLTDLTISGLTANRLVLTTTGGLLTTLATGASGTVIIGGTIPSYSASPTLTGLVLSGLTASNIVMTNGSKALSSLAVLTVPNGGTGASTLNDNGVLYGNATAAVAATAEGATGQLLTGSTGNPPAWSATPTVTTITGTTSVVAGSSGNTTTIDNTGLTLAGTATVFDDLYVPVATGKIGGANTPSWASFTTNTSLYTFGIDDYIDLPSVEIKHDWLEGSALNVHIHYITNGANDATARKVKWTIYFTIGDMGEAMAAEDTLTAEDTIPANEADKTHHYLDMGDITGTNYKIGAQIIMRVKRIAGTGTEPANEPFLSMVGIHYEIDTLGSKTETAK